MDLVKKLSVHGKINNSTLIKSLTKTLLAKDITNENYYEEEIIYYSPSSELKVDKFETQDSENALYKLVKLIKTKNHFSDAWSFLFRKNDKGNWNGALVGKHEDLYNKVIKPNMVELKKKELISTKPFSLPTSITSTQAFTNLNMLKPLATKILTLVDSSSEWVNESILRKHLKALVFFSRNSVLAGSDNEGIHIKFSTHNKVVYVFNTGILDKFANFIHLEVTLILATNREEDNTIIEPFYIIKSVSISDSNYLRIGKTLEPFYVIKDFNYFDISNSISTESTVGLQHIIEDRRSRLPADFRDLSNIELLSSLEGSIELAKKMGKIDRLYFQPYYSSKWNKISFMIPLYIRGTLSAAITLGSTTHNKWIPVTILTLEDAYINSRLLGVVHSWLKDVT